MSQKVMFSSDTVYANQAALNAQLVTLNSANPISVLITHGNTQADQWARLWAQQNGVPWMSQASALDAEGYIDPPSRTLKTLLRSNSDQILTAGTGAAPTAAANVGTTKGKTVTKL